MNGIKVEHYDCVEDILEEGLFTLCGIEPPISFSYLEKDVLYVAGTINIVKLGNKPNTLKHKHRDKWSEDIEVTKSYNDALYYRLDQISNLVEKHLTREFYNNDFLVLD